jgi:hypothetical protein
MYRKKLLYVAIYAIGMAYLEAAIVVYLRRFYGITDLMTSAPPFDPQISLIEVGRELATLIMLLAVGLLSGKRLQSKIGFAIYAFGLWDIFYYVWLAVFIGWPKSLFDWDLLFLIPLPWWGPVIAPVMIAALMVLCGSGLAALEDKERILRPTKAEWLLLVLGICVMLYVFMADAIAQMPASIETLARLRPSSFLWGFFVVGYLISAYSAWRILSAKSVGKPSVSNSGRENNVS